MLTNPYASPGIGTEYENKTGELTWGGRERQVLTVSRPIDGTTRSGSSAILQPGMLLGKITATGRLVHWSPVATDGSAKVAAINPYDLKMIDATGANVENYIAMLMQAPLQAEALYIGDTKMVGHNYEMLARQQLSELGCTFDDGITGVLSTAGKVVNANYSLVAADYNTSIVVTGVRTITVPAATVGIAGVEVRLSASGGDTTLAGGVTGTIPSGSTAIIRGELLDASTAAWFKQGI